MKSGLRNVSSQGHPAREKFDLVLVLKSIAVIHLWIPRNPAKIDYSSGFSPGFDHFIVIEDPRTGGHKKYHFGEMIFIAVSALVCGVQSFSAMIEFAHIHRDWLEKWISNGG